MFTKTQVAEALKENFGFDTFKGNQEDIIMNLLEGKDSFVLMPTGGRARHGAGRSLGAGGRG